MPALYHEVTKVRPKYPHPLEPVSLLLHTRQEHHRPPGAFPILNTGTSLRTEQGRRTHSLRGFSGIRLPLATANCRRRAAQNVGCTNDLPRNRSTFHARNAPALSWKIPVDTLGVPAMDGPSAGTLVCLPLAHGAPARRRALCFMSMSWMTTRHGHGRSPCPLPPSPINSFHYPSYF